MPRFTSPRLRRKISIEEKFFSCGECELLDTCDKLASLSKGYKNENIKNLKGLNDE